MCRRAAAPFVTMTLVVFVLLCVKYAEVAILGLLNLTAQEGVRPRRGRHP